MRLISIALTALRLYPMLGKLYRNGPSHTYLLGFLAVYRTLLDCPIVVSHQEQPSKSGPKRFFYPTQPYNKRISPVKACLVFFAALVLILMIASPSGPISVLEGLFQLFAWGPFSLCESGWTCNAPGDVTWFGVVK